MQNMLKLETQSYRLQGVTKKANERKRKADTYIPHSTTTTKSKNIEIDQDGFQHAKSKKNIRRDIFDNGNMDMREHAMDQSKEARELVECHNHPTMYNPLPTCVGLTL